MKKIKNISLFILTFLALSPKAYAYCTDYEKNHFKEIENQYKITYDYDAKNDKNIMKIYNPEPNKYEYRVRTDTDSNANVVFKRIDNYNYEVTGKIYVEYTIEVVGKTSTCNDVLKTIVLSPPPQDGYHNDKLCEGIEDFILCQSEYTEPVTREEFESRVEAYKESIQKDNNINTPGNNTNNTPNDENNGNTTDSKNIINKTISYIQENIVQVIIIIIFIILLVVTAIISIKSAIKSRRLE